MENEERKLRSLEGLGYIAACMIAVGGLWDSTALRYFNLLGLVFAIIVIIRLMVMNVSMGLVRMIYEPQATLDAELPLLEDSLTI